MKLEAKREQLLKPLQHVIGAVERRQTLPILTNVLLVAGERELTLTATDLEVELSTRIELPAIEKLCALLKCHVGDLLEVVPDQPEGQS